MRESSSGLLRLLVNEVALRHGYGCEEIGGEFVLTGAVGGRVVLPCTRLDRRMARAPRQLWSALIADRLDTQIADLAAGHLDQSRLESVRPLLRTRLCSARTKGLINDVRRLVAPGLLQRVLVDFGDIMAPVTYAGAQRWGAKESDLFEIAERNTRAEGGLDLTAAEIDGMDDVDIQMLYGASDFVTAHVRWLDDYPVVGPWGALLVIPGHTHLLVHPITGPTVFAGTSLLAQLLVAGEAESPPIGRSIYWWRNRITVDIAATVRGSGDRMEVVPADHLESLLEIMRRA
ncbi:hypothetical protein DFR70_104256 [Nocardia tenerifensis]|uniref:Uncharacterized protein n=2 Tax=Nocardia tenerifensis TaxID=228006 RepID=A0A318K116_9NOCA|nr:hypothetical protein [Nocardia tenerifensis]PXX65194.1 hypothetical protein DFR70_104256 [Nocardia tenerifensis]